MNHRKYITHNGNISQLNPVCMNGVSFMGYFYHFKQIISIFRCTEKLYEEEFISHGGIIKSLLIMVFKRDHRDYKSDGLMGVHFDYEAALFPANHRQSVEKKSIIVISNTRNLFV